MAIFLGIYTLFLVFIWGFFIITKIHAYKFKNFSERIEIVTKSLLVILIILSIMGYIIIFHFYSGGNNSKSVSPNQDYFNTISY